METKRSIGQYVGEYQNKTFVIPAYQRGFKWGVKNEHGHSAATVLLRNIISAQDAEQEEYFIQGITVYEEGTNVYLIDGQQRTTTLFILLSLLLSEEEKIKYLFHENSFKLKYEIREASHVFLEKLCKGSELPGPDTQDTYYFLEVKQQLNDILKEQAREKLKMYILNQLKLFYISIAKHQATKVFTMMNGAKAYMKTDELVKADILSKAARIEFNGEAAPPKDLRETLEILKNQVGEDWRSNALRSRFARQWDKWMYWWNQEETKLFFNSGENPMGLLLPYFYAREKVSGKLEKGYSQNTKDVAEVFKSFQNLFINDKKSATESFERLRKLQKKFEDIYNNSEVHNYFGLAHETIRDRARRKEVVHYFLNHYKNVDKIRDFVLLAILNKKNDDSSLVSKDIKDEIVGIFDSIHRTKVYVEEDKEYVFRLLLKINVEAANDRGVKFDFFIKNQQGNFESLYSSRSLEHIWPRSKGLEIEDRLKTGSLSIDHIGNLVLLHKNDNSKFNDKVPEDKKKVYFNLHESLLSRNLLHSMSVFAYDNWSKENAANTIAENQKKVLELMKKGYEDYVS